LANVTATKFSFGYRTPRLIQIFTEDPPPFPDCLAFEFAVVWANEFSLEFTFDLFGIFPTTCVMDGITLYGPMRSIIETPGQKKFLNTPAVSVIGYTCPKPWTCLAADVYWNGFNFSKVPMFHYLWLLYFEWFWEYMLGDGETNCADWVSNSWHYRNFDRYCSDESYWLFQDIAKMSEHDEKPERFSMPSKAIERWDETYRMRNERVALAAKQLAPNEEIIWMPPLMPDSEVEPVFQYKEERPPCSWAETQTDMIVTE
jgi:hypothetical protein